MFIEYNENTMTIHGIKDFSLEQCLTSRTDVPLEAEEGEGFAGVALGHAVYAVQKGPDLTLSGVGNERRRGFYTLFRSRARLREDKGKHIKTTSSCLREWSIAGGNTGA